MTFWSGTLPPAGLRASSEKSRPGRRSQARLLREVRLILVCGAFVLAFLTVGAKMTMVSMSEPVEPSSSRSGTRLVSQRAEIVDRNGISLAANLSTYSIYAHPDELVEAKVARKAAVGLAKIFPDLDVEELHRKFTGGLDFIWIRKKISPEQRQQVHDIGAPGLHFGSRDARVYMNSELGAHVLGGTSYGTEGSYSAEVIGVAGVEKSFDSFLADPANGGKPLSLSIDLTAQHITRKVLLDGVKLLNAVGGSAVLMDANNGEILSLVSLPDFDPNARGHYHSMGRSAHNPLFNRAVQGVYEFGSTFKIFAAAQALDMGLVTIDSEISTMPFSMGKYTIKEAWSNRRQAFLSVKEIIANSSNTGIARLALMIGPTRQKEFFTKLGMTRPLDIELPEAPTSAPLLPRKWTDYTVVTVSYGHGISITPIHLAAAYAAMVNGGILVKPSIVRGGNATAPRIQVISEDTSRDVRSMLRAVVEEGTGRQAVIQGYSIGGKTGTADKIAKGVYLDDKVLATFAAVFPADEPRYVLVVSLDEPDIRDNSKTQRSAGRTVVPVAAEMIARLAPILGVRPEASGVERTH